MRERPRRHRRPILLALLALAACGLGASAARDAKPVPAPPIELRDTTGKTHVLPKDRIVVIEWVNFECPYVRRHYESGAMIETYRRVKAVAPDAAWFAIDSTRRRTARDVEAWRRKHELPYPVLMDPDGTVARAYDARRTPHVYVIDPAGAIRYHGAVDDDRHGRKPRSDVESYVVRAVRQIVAGEDVQPDHVRPYGCTIKLAGRDEGSREPDRSSQ